MKIVVPAHPDHICRIAGNMSPEDRAECEAGGMGPYRALKSSFDGSVIAWTGMVDDNPVCMLGVSPLDILGGVGSPWLLGTPEVRKYAVTFLRLSRQYVCKMLDIFPHLINFVDVRHTIAIRWLKWLGFGVDAEPVAYGPFGAPFYRFEMRK